MQQTLHIEKYDSYPYLAESMRSHHELLWQPARQQYSQNHWFKLRTANFILFWSQAAILDSHVHEVRQSSISLCINVFGVLSEFITTVCCIATNNYACPSRLFINLVCSRKAGHTFVWLNFRFSYLGKLLYWKDTIFQDVKIQGLDQSWKRQKEFLLAVSRSICDKPSNSVLPLLGHKHVL